MLSMRSARGSVLLLLAAVLPISLYAQVSSGNTDNDPTTALVARLSTDVPAVGTGTLATSGDSLSPLDTAAQPSTALAPESAPSQAGSTSDEPPGQGSTVGYIDNAIVGSEVRVRFDAGFGDSQPDLAEFFYAQCGCDGGTAAGPKPGLATDLNFQQLYLRGEYAPKKFFSFMLELPLRFIQPVSFAPATVSSASPGFGDQGGLSDVSAGFKLAAVASKQQYLTFQLVATFPSGDSGKGLGTDHYTVAPSLLYYRKVTDRFSLEGELGDSHPIGGDTPGFAGDVVEYGIGPSYVAYKSEKVQFAPVLELVGWRIFGGMWNNPALLGVVPGLPLDTADGSNIVNLKGGARTSIGKNQSFYVGYGHALTTANIWYKQILRIEYRRTF